MAPATAIKAPYQSASRVSPGLAHDATEPDVRGRRINRFGEASGRSIPPTVVLGAEVRAALQHLARYPDRGKKRIEAAVHGAPAWIRGAATRLARVFGVARAVPVGRPFPDVADHVIQTVAVGRIRAHGRRAFPTVNESILMWKLALPPVGHRSPVRHQLLTPGIGRPVEATARRILPLRLGR